MLASIVPFGAMHEHEHKGEHKHDHHEDDIVQFDASMSTVSQDEHCELCDLLEVYDWSSTVAHVEFDFTHVIWTKSNKEVTALEVTSYRQCFSGRAPPIG